MDGAGSDSLPRSSLLKSLEFDETVIERFAEVANEAADAAGVVIRKYFRKSFDVHDKADFSELSLFLNFGGFGL